MNKNILCKNNPNWKGGISLDRKKYEKKYWKLNKEKRQEIARKCYQKNKLKYHKKRQERYYTEAFKLQRKIQDQKNHIFFYVSEYLY